MFDALISTKFHSPLTMGRMTLRPRLDARLDESLQAGCHLALVTAPAGFGKSTLVSAWVRNQRIPFSWLSLDSNDNEPRQFLSYLVGALQKIDVSLGASQVTRIQTAETADTEAVYADVMAHLVNEIAAMPGSFLLVLDDCHLLKNPLPLRLLNFLIERQPLQLHLILLSREDLPLPISRLRVRRQVVEVRQTDLQFQADEAADFLREGLGIHQLSSQDILALEQRTEGWIAGLQLAGLSIRSDPDPAHFIKSFTGSDRYILDYLMEEVFNHQDGEIQQFLLATSILERFCAPLCEAVVAAMPGHADASADGARAKLELIERSNLFLIPLDYQRNWYRYHHLFADLLHHALRQAAQKKIPELHLRASQWLEANGFIQEAVRHAFQTQDWLYAAEMVERHAWNTILHSQVAVVSEWCRTFPESVIKKRPALCIFHGWALIVAFKKEDFPAATIRIEQAEAALPEIDPQAQACLLVGAPPVNLKSWVTGQLTLLRSFILMAAPRRQADPQALIDLGQLSYDQLPVEDVSGRSVGLLDISYASQARGDAADAEEKFAHVVSVALSGGNYFGAVVAEYHRAHGLLAQGRLRQAVEFCVEKKRVYESYFTNPLQELPAIALLDQARGCALLELNKLEEAEQLLRSGLEVGQWMPREELPAYLALARLCAVKGDESGWAEALRRLDMRWPDIVYCTQAMRLAHRLQSQVDDPETRQAASAWAEANPPEIGPGIVLPGIGPAWYDEADYAVYTAWVQVQILLGKCSEALSVIGPMHDSASQYGLHHRVIGLSLLRAQALYCQGQKRTAWDALRAALARAEEEGYLRLADQGGYLPKMLEEAAALGIAPGYVQRLRANMRLGLGQPESPAAGHAKDPAARPATGRSMSIPELVEPLSNREIEVLRLMAEGLSNAEVATRLYLSTNTLKSHTQHIYEKLDVHSRVQAVNKARELKLL